MSIDRIIIKKCWRLPPSLNIDSLNAWQLFSLTPLLKASNWVCWTQATRSLIVESLWGYLVDTNSCPFLFMQASGTKRALCPAEYPSQNKGTDIGISCRLSVSLSAAPLKLARITHPACPSISDFVTLSHSIRLALGLFNLFFLWVDFSHTITKVTIYLQGRKASLCQWVG